MEWSGVEWGKKEEREGRYTEEVREGKMIVG